MALKLHILAEDTKENGRRSGKTACGVPIFKSIVPAPEECWESGRVIGGVRAVKEGDFMPSRHGDCVRCRKIWENG